MIPTVPFDVTLSSTTKARFDERGYATIPRITSDEEVSWFHRVYDRLLVAKLAEASQRPGGIQGAPNNTLWISLNLWETMVFQRTALIRNAHRLASGLLDVSPDDISMGIRFFFKPSHGGRPVPWHQDEAHKDPAFDHHSVNVWVPFDPATEENGCLWYLPGSHAQGVRVHRHPGYGAPEVALATEDVRLCDAEPAVLPPAGASFHHCRAVHGSGSNNTEQHRRAMVIVCSAPPRRRQTPAERPWLATQHVQVPETSF